MSLRLLLSSAAADLGWRPRSSTVPVCWWSHGGWEGASGPDDVCWVLSVGKGGSGVPGLSHKACSVSPWQLGLGMG